MSSGEAMTAERDAMPLTDPVRAYVNGRLIHLRAVGHLIADRQHRRICPCRALLAVSL